MTAIFDPNTGQWSTRPGLMGGGAAPAGVSLGPGGTYMNTPAQSQTVEGRTNALSRSGSELMQAGAKTGQQFVASRGLMNSSLGAQAGRAGSLQAILPIATADAQMSAQANAQNAEALNAVNIANQNRAAATSVGGAYVGPNAIDRSTEFERQKEIMRYQNQLEREAGREEREWRSGESERDRGLTRSESAAERGWRSSESGLDRNLTREEWGARQAEADRQRGWQSSEAELDRGFEDYMQREGARNTMFSGVMSQLFSTILGSPEYLRNPRNAQGVMDFFTNQFGSMWSQFMGRGTTPTTPAPGGT